jgi:flagellar motility protein MotE (MotC chaperone)
MKRLGPLLLLLGRGLSLLCIATFLSQVVLLATLWSRGMLTTQKLARVQTVLSGVEYDKIRADLLTAAEQQANDPKTRAVNARLAAQDSALQRRASDVALVESRLRESSRRFELQEETFNSKITTLENEVLRTTREQLIKTIRNMAPDQIKVTFVNMLRDQAGGDVLAVLRQSSPAEQSKIFAEFQTDEEQVLLNDILSLMRQTSAGN